METLQDYIHIRINCLVQKIMLCEDERKSILLEVKTWKNTAYNSGDGILEQLLDNYETMLANIEVTMEKNEKDLKEKPRKCGYFNRGFCKYGDKCHYFHAPVICHEYLEEGNCGKTSCSERHPKACKYWAESQEGCHRQESCQYLHRDSERYDGNDIVNLAGDQETREDQTCSSDECDTGEENDLYCEKCNCYYWNKNDLESHRHVRFSKCVNETDHNERLEQQMMTSYENMFS